MNKSKRIILFFILIMLLALLCVLTAMIIIIRREENAKSIISYKENIISNETPQTVKDIIEKHDSEYISEDKNTVYATLSRDLYDENGKSNKDFIDDLVSDLDAFFQDESFYIIDESKKIKIFVKKTSEKESYDLIINDKENFYEETDGKSYSAVENSKIVDSQSLPLSNDYLEKLQINNMYFKYLEEDLTNGRELDNGYMMYVDQQIKVKLLPNKSVFNLIFMEDYEDIILNNVSLKNRLKEIAETYDDYVFGGLDKEYLGYRSGSYYYFFYENEASIYPYSYKENEKFENILTEYVTNKDLDNFENELKKTMKSYVDYEYDSDIKKLTMNFPTRGIKINIKDNDPKGITLYSNYHFTDTTKKLVKDGDIQYNKNDFVDEYEQMRKENE